MRISDWSSDVCSSDLLAVVRHVELAPQLGDMERHGRRRDRQPIGDFLVRLALRQIVKNRHLPRRKRDRRLLKLAQRLADVRRDIDFAGQRRVAGGNDMVERSEEHTSELQSLMRTSYAVFCLKKKKITYITTYYTHYVKNTTL